MSESDRPSLAGPVRQDIRLTLRRIAGGARLVGLAWMLVLVLVALAREPLPNPGFAWALAGAAVVWGLLTGLDQLRSHDSDPAWITAGDALLASFALLAPDAAGTTDLFYGGFPGIAVAAAAVRGRRWGWAVAGVLSVVTLARFEVADLGDVLSRLSQLVTYLMLAGIVGWAVHVIYETDAARRLAEDAEARAEEKSRVAAHLHDSVLQTLALIQRESSDPTRVVGLGPPPRTRTSRLAVWRHRPRSRAVWQTLSDRWPQRSRSPIGLRSMWSQSVTPRCTRPPMLWSEPGARP